MTVDTPIETSLENDSKVLRNVRDPSVTVDPPIETSLENDS